MWTTTKWILIVISFFALAYLFFGVAMSPSFTRACQQKYGGEWRAHFQGQNYCINEKGELRAP